MEPGFATIMRSLAVVLLIVHMILGFFVWSEDYADNRLRVVRLSFVVIVAVILLFIIYLSGRYLA
jgi:succinate dehydrogenase hydrophobic anchor subunit